MNLLTSLFARIRARLVALANDGAEIAVVNSTEEAAVFNVNQDGALFVPFGEYRHKKGVQVFDRAAAESMRGFANSLAGTILRAPIYVGHPDVAGRADTNPAAPAIGWVTDILIENDGARFITKMGKRGKAAIDDAEFRFYSPNWACARKPGGKLRPARLLSIGLTNHPNIPVPALSNDSTQTEETMNPELLKLLGLDPAANDGAGPTAEEIEAARIRLADRLTKAENDAATVPGLAEQITTLTTRATTAEGKVTSLESQVSAANDAVTAARAARIDATLERAVAGGILAEADRGTRRTELVAIENDADLTTALVAIEATKPTLKTTSRVTGMDRAKANLAAENDAAARSEKRRKAVDEEMTSIANDLSPKARYDLAWERAARKHPDLFTDKKD